MANAGRNRNCCRRKVKGIKGSDVEAGNENSPAFVRSCGNLNINYVLHQLDHNKPSAICNAAQHIPQQNHRAAFL